VHQDWDNSQEFVAGYIRFVANMFDATFSPDARFAKTKIVPAIGNHDTFPIDQLDVPPKYGWLLSNVTINNYCSNCFSSHNPITNGCLLTPKFHSPHLDFMM
jgi:hypothetical protein